jgi:hypothetical protein
MVFSIVFGIIVLFFALKFWKVTLGLGLIFCALVAVAVFEQYGPGGEMSKRGFGPFGASTVAAMRPCHPQNADGTINADDFWSNDCRPVPSAAPPCPPPPKVGEGADVNQAFPPPGCSVAEASKPPVIKAAHHVIRDREDGEGSWCQPLNWPDAPHPEVGGRCYYGNPLKDPSTWRDTGPYPSGAAVSVENATGDGGS